MLGLRPYQELAADFIYANDRSLVLAPVGAGKTAITLTAMEAMLKDGIVSRWLVIAPRRVAVEVWPVETPKWSALRINVAVGAPQERRNAVDGRPKSDIVVINYENLQWLAEQYPDLSLLFDGIVFDELTRAKTPGNPRSKSTTVQKKGKRYEAINRAIKGIGVRVGLTGSFTSNGLEDVFGQVRMIDNSVLGSSKGAFLQQYFWCANPQFGDWIPRPKSLEQIMQRIKPVTFLLEPGEYTDTLPPLHTVELRCDMPDRAPYERMKKDFVLKLGNDAQAIALNAGVVTQKLQQLAGGWVYETSTVVSDVPGKFNVTQTPHWFSAHKFNMLDELLEENHHDNTIVWYWYKEELAELKRRYPKAQTLDDANAVSRWNEGKINLLLAHPMSAGHGLNLQFGGCKLAFLSLPWSLELFEQSIGRLLRSGQRHDVWCYLLLTNNTIDEQIWAALQGKKAFSEIAVEALKNN